MDGAIRRIQEGHAFVADERHQRGAAGGAWHAFTEFLADALRWCVCMRVCVCVCTVLCKSFLLFIQS